MKKETEFNTQNQGDSVYLVTVTETLTRTFKVSKARAKDSDEAEGLVRNKYQKGDIILDADDFAMYEISARKHTNENLDLYEDIDDVEGLDDIFDEDEWEDDLYED